MALKLLQWNICGVRSKLNLLRAALAKEAFDVVLLQETLLREGQLTSLKGYRPFYLPAVPGETRGCGILVRDTIPCSRVPRPVRCGEGVEVLAVRVTLPNTAVDFYSIYSGQAAEPDFTELLSVASQEPTFIGGDFNAHHELWGSHRRNRAGRLLAATLEDTPRVALLNTGEPTHVAGGILDLSLVTSPLAVDATWSLHPDLASDHFATVIRLPVSPPAPPPRPPRWNLKRADWGRFKSAITRRLQATARPEDLNAAEERLVNIFTEAANEAIPRTHPTVHLHRDRWYYCAEVREANRRVNQARKVNRRHNTEATRGLLRAAIRSARTTANAAQERQWLAWCASLSSSTSTADLWRKIRLVASGARARPALHPRPQEEAERLINHFASRSASNMLPPATMEAVAARTPARLTAFRDACRLPHAADTPLTLSELQGAFRSKDSAPGADHLPYSFLQHAGPVMEAELLHLYNLSFAQGTLPASWKAAVITPIPKKGLGAQFRPISLLSCMGKTLERILLARLQWAMGPLHHHLFAFRRGTGTRDCISTLLATVLGRQAVAVFVDLEKAFELASAPAILSILARKGVQGRLLAWIGDYLQERRAAVRFQGHVSSTTIFQNGTPQGGILSPVLFNVLVEELANLSNSTNVKVLSYADDVAIVATGPNHVARARTLLRRLQHSCTSLGLAINRDKTRAMAFRYRRLPEPFHIDGAPVPWTTLHRYLGVHLDSRLSFTPYIRTLSRSVKSRTNVMRALTRLSGGASERVLRTFYVHAVRACVDYATPCLLTAPPALLTPLDTAQNSALRIIVGAPLWTKCLCLRAEAKISDVPTRISQLSVGHLVTLLRPQAAAPLRATVRQALLHLPQLHTARSWANTAAALIRSHHLSHALLSASDAPHPHYSAPPPWAPAISRTTISPLPTRKGSMSEGALLREAQRRVRAANRPGATIYYTDGSANHPTGAVGAAFVTATATALSRLPDGSSSTQAELVAILLALQHAVEVGGAGVVIHSDSAGALQALSCPPVRDNINLLTSIHVLLDVLHTAGRRVDFSWLPSHAGIAGNEAADRAANEAALLPAPTHHIPPSISQCKRLAARNASTSTISAVSAAHAAGSPSASWFATATATASRPMPPAASRKLEVHLHRLRLGFKSYSLLDPDNVTPVDCPHCEEEVQYPLLHYLLECHATRPLLPNPNQLTAPELLLSLSDDALIQLITSYEPPR